MTLIFLHGRGSSASIGRSERRAVIGKRGALALLPEGLAPPVFDDRILGATRGGCRTRSAARKASEVAHGRPAPRWRVPSRFLAPRRRLGLVGVGRTSQIFTLAGGHPANVGRLVCPLPSGWLVPMECAGNAGNDCDGRLLRWKTGRFE